MCVNTAIDVKLPVNLIHKNCDTAGAEQSVKRENYKSFYDNIEKYTFCIEWQKTVMCIKIIQIQIFDFQNSHSIDEQTDKQLQM